MSLKTKFLHLVIDAAMLILCIVVGTSATDNVWAGVGLAVLVAIYAAFNFQQGAALLASKGTPL